MASVHDIESYFGLDNALSLNLQIFTAHWAHISIILMWISGNLYHIASNANYSLWIKNPIPSMAQAHNIWDPHFTATEANPYSHTTTAAVLIAYSGIYNQLYTSGFSTINQIYKATIIYTCLAVISILLAKIHVKTHSELLHKLYINKSQVHQALSTLCLVTISSVNIRLNFHTAVPVAIFSIAYTGHLLDVAIPASRAVTEASQTSPAKSIYTYLTFFGGLKSDTASLYLTDIAHHHLAIGVIFVFIAHLYSSFRKAIGTYIRDILYTSTELRGTSYDSLHKALSLALAGCAVLTSITAQHIYSLTPYFYLSYDYVTSSLLYVHHTWIASFLSIGSHAHAAIGLVRDWVAPRDCDKSCLTSRIHAHKAAIISHLSWVSIFLGFHTLALYTHNDTCMGFGSPSKQILIEPTNAQLIQQSSGKALYSFATHPTYNNYNKSFGSFIYPVGPGDLYVHHAIALGLHVSVLILLKGALQARGSKLMPDKMEHSYGFSCDGPGRGGTCDISAWDSFYLAMFWMLNTNAWIDFYFHYKYLTPGQFSESSTYLESWFRDYLWFNSAPLIRGYSALGTNDLSVQAWFFLLTHLAWATGFMFLISWRGYWQELIDIILYMHLKTPILIDLWNGGVYTPLALSIVQARFIGLVHFSAGLILTYPPFVISATS
mmetsp:Transcript_6945/g.14901  ORF Transcript_6945/g.14901 Transcript_6945/m.14901 type:complete len:662 (-) Transcript_6945:7-1992(-)